MEVPRFLVRLGDAALRPLPNSGRGWHARTRVRIFRIVGVMCALLTLPFWFVYHAADPATVDPLSLRLVIAGTGLGMVGLSYVSEGVRRHAVAISTAGGYLLTVWFAALTYLNGLNALYALGFLFVVLVVALLNSLSFREVAPVVWYVLFAFATTVLLVVVTPEPGFDPPLFIFGIGSCLLTLYIALAAYIQIQDSLTHSNAGLAEAQRVAGLGSWEYDPAAGRTYWSDEMYRISGIDPSERPSLERFFSLIHPDDRGRFVEATQTDRTLEAFVARIVRPDGAVRTLSIRGEAETNARGERVRYFGACQDITAEAAREEALVAARERAEEAREEAEAARAEAEELARLKSHFLANMSHEIRTPLTAIIGFAQMLAEEVEGEQQEFAGLIERSGRRLLHTLNSVLDLARLKAGRVDLRPAAVPVPEVAHAVADMLRPMAEGKGLTLTVRVEGAAGGDGSAALTPGSAPAAGAELTAWADPAALDRVLTNLVSNAVKFTSKGGVTIAVAPAGERVRIEVRDTGIGVSPEFLPQLFDEFRQESEGEAREHEGSGLGLAITSRLVECMGGTVSAESELGRGSTFTVLLAASEGAAEPSPAVAC